MMIEIKHGDCLEVMRTMDAASVDSIVTDPPYGLKFMAKNWDHGVPGTEFWREALRVAKHGTHLLAFGGTRTFHRLAVAIEDAGWEIRDCVMWVYGGGFPKSLDVSKAIDKAAGAKRDVVATVKKPSASSDCNEGWARPWAEGKTTMDITAPATEAARQWSGWGTALKPAWEPVIVARKPLDGTVAKNVLKHGTGALNIDNCRIESSDGTTTARKPAMVSDTPTPFGKGVAMGGNGSDKGRWPANLIHDGSDDVLRLFPQSRDDSAARFFYCAKASKVDRGADNRHPTVKPTALMRYLCRLVTPPGGIVLDPFCGSGSTGKAAAYEGFHFIGIEKEAEYCAIARERTAAAVKCYEKKTTYP